MSSFGQNRFCVDVYEVGLFFGLKFVVYYIDNHFGGDGGGGGRGGQLSVEFYGYVTKHNYSFQ